MVTIVQGVLQYRFLTNFIAMPTLGGLSDRFGRRPVLLASMATLALDFIIMGLASALWVLFLGRFLSGISSATFSTANAYIADTTTPEKRGQAFGMIGASFGIGFVLGPAIGGLIGMIDPRAPFFAAAAVAGLNLFYGLFVLPESLKPENARPFSLLRSNPLGAFVHFSKLPKVAWFLVGLAVAALAHAVYPATWAFHGEIRYDWLLPAFAEAGYRGDVGAEYRPRGGAPAWLPPLRAALGSAPV